MRLAVIPARGGSKRIPRKNIKPFSGKPIMAWPIEAAIESGCFDRVIVSTDDQEIAETARQSGAETPFVRPAEISDDHATTADVMAHAAEWQSANGQAAEHICCIYPTAPFVRPQDLREGLARLMQEGCSYVFSAASYAFPIARALRLTQGSRVAMYYPEHQNTRSQDLEDAYHDAGQFYWGTCDAWRMRHPIFSGQSAALVLPRYRVQDIDTAEDWERAEWMFRQLTEAKDL